MIPGRTISRCVSVMVAVATVGSMAQIVFAQGGSAPAWPTQPIRLVVGFAPGGGMDLVARVIAPKFAERLGQPAIVENRPGAGAIIGAETVARATPDGHTLLVAPPSTMTINPALYSKLSYDPMRDFEPIVLVSNNAFVLTVTADSPIKSVEALVAWSKANPAKANYASTSTTFQLTTELFKLRTGARLEHIPFKGSGEMMTAILTGQVTTAFVDTQPLMSHVRAGKVRLLATAGSRRFPAIPDVPTLTEIGVNGVTVDGWGGLVAPKRTPAAVIQLLEREINTIIKLPDVLERFAAIGVSPGGGTSAEFRQRVEREAAMWKDVVKAAGIKVE